MPNTSAGIQAPASALLLAAPDFDDAFDVAGAELLRLLRELLADIAYDIHAAMSAPAPGSAPIAVPSALPRRICSGYFLASAHWPAKTLPTFSTHQLAGGCVSTAKRMISEIANMPIIIGIMPMPPVISALPKVKRGKRRRVAEADAGDQQPEQQRRPRP